MCRDLEKRGANSMEELDRLYDWLYDLHSIRVSYGKAGAKQIYQEDLDIGMKLYIAVKKKVQGREKGLKLYFDTMKITEHLEKKINER